MNERSLQLNQYQEAPELSAMHSLDAEDENLETLIEIENQYQEEKDRKTARIEL